MASSDTELVLALVLALVIVVLSIWRCIVRCNRAAEARNHRRATAANTRREDPLREALVPAAAGEGHASTANRAQASFRHAAEGANACGFCGFENLRRFRFCRLCTSALPKPPPPSASSAAASDYEQLEIREARRPLRTLNVVQRQVRAKLRAEWRRRLDVAGDLFWFRDDVGGFNSSATRFPGYALRFAADSGVFGGGHGSSKVVVEATRSKQEVIDALNLEVVVAEPVLTESSRANPAQLPVDDGHLGSLHWRPVLDLAAQGFLTKYACFAAAAAGFLVPAQEQLVRLMISRAALLEDSMEALAVLSRGSIRASVHVSFIGDSYLHQHQQQQTSSDTAAKRYAEWFMYLTHQLAEPAFGVFRAITNTEQTFYLNANSLHDIGEHHLLYYFATGRLVGRALLEGHVLGFHLALPLLKLMLGLPVSFNDLEYVDPDGYQRLVNLLRVDDADEILAMDLHFCVVEQHGSSGSDSVGAGHVVDLIPDGRSVQVTNLNKDEYLHRVFQHALVECVASQLYVFLKGLYEVVPQELLVLFDPEEFDYVLCNADEINLNAWTKRKTRSTSASSSRSGEGIDIDIGAEVVVEGAGLLMELFDL